MDTNFIPVNRVVSLFHFGPLNFCLAPIFSSVVQRLLLQHTDPFEADSKEFNVKKKSKRSSLCLVHRADWKQQAKLTLISSR